MRIMGGIGTFSLAVMTAFSAMHIGVQANNHSDTSVGKMFSNVNEYYFTAIREKEDSSSAYFMMRDKSTASTVKVQVFGYDSSTNGQIDLTARNFYIIKRGQYVYLDNYVYENGYRQARLKLICNEPGLVDALWSPDSI